MTFTAFPPDFVNLSAAIRGLSQSEFHSAAPFRLDPSPLPTSPNPAGEQALSVLGEPLEICSCQPLTGWRRDGRCRTDSSDLGQHTVCCVVTENFLSYSRSQGNDLSTPMPAYGFPGLKPGDHWCVCAARWLEAHQDGVAPPVCLEATEQSALQIIPLELLRQTAVKA
ncbi:DUF2237 domain-containing protein [Synechococcus sp. CS-602]|nr:DUF2237 domain-containing protein [Synechococcus sp. CS-602]MCT0246370.1 DUF2237 domain-containing protein [Synechococcus sp. CS-601]TWB93368.1 hypothetical protein FB106_104151 [Synechococcus sp. Ace-Pa]